MKMNRIGDLAISINYNDIERFIVEALPFEIQSVKSNLGNNLKGSITSFNKQLGLSAGGQNNSRRSSTSIAGGLAPASPTLGSFFSKKKDQQGSSLIIHGGDFIKKAYYVTFYTRSEVYKFFPLVEKEVTFLKAALLECAGLKPTFPDHFVRQLLVILLFN